MAKSFTYSVTMYRFGERKNDSYILGVYDKKHQAIKECEAEEEYRGQKYMGEVIEHVTGTKEQKVIRELKKAPWCEEEESEKEKEKARVEKIMRQFS